MKITCFLFLAWCSASADAAVLAFGAARDATIFQNNVSNSNGAGPGLFAGTNGTSSPRRGLIAFDLTSIPAGSIITDVQFTLTLGQIAGSGGSGAATSTVDRTFGLFKLTKNWGEGTTGSTATGIGGTGQGFAAGDGDATWNAAAYSASTPTLWSNPGGDFAGTASATLTAPLGAIAGNTYTWLSTPALVADAQDWLEHPATNFGWAIVNAAETGSQTFFSFYTKEWSDASGGDPAQEPRLQLTYTVPEAGSGMLLAGVALAWLSTRPVRRSLKSCT